MSGRIIEKGIIDTLEQNYMPYAMSVIVSRAIPEIDGFKPAHRKLLYTMYKMGLLGGNKTKSANVVGQTMKLNPHGDMAIYETLVRLTRGNDAILHPLIDSKGNFGKHYSRDMRFAAPRYTEVKLDKICEEIFKDIDKDTVEFADNYDRTLKEPKLLPTSFPNLLVNSNQGIAVGMASNICGFNLKEVCEATVAYIADPNVDLLRHIKAPDFPTGGQLIFNLEEMSRVIETGRGGFRLRAKYKFDKANNCIEIYNIPYTTSVEAIIDSVTELVKSGKIKEISDIRDETDLKGLKITLDLKRNTDHDNLMNKLFKLTTLQDTFSCNFNVLIDGRPKVLGVRQIIHEWLIFRVSCIKRQIQFDIKKKSDKLHLLLGLKEILLDIDKAIKIVRETEREVDVVPNLMSGFGIDEIQAEFVAEIKLRDLNMEYILKRVGEVDALIKDIDRLKKIYESESEVNKIIIKQLGEVSKTYGHPRRTEIIDEGNIEEVTEQHFIEDYNVRLFLTQHNYFKKISLVSLRSMSEHKIKEEDRIIQEIETHNKAELLLFSNKATVYKLKVYDINDCKASSLGEYLTNVLGLEGDEEIIYMVATDDYKGFMLFSYENGKIAKIDLEGYVTKTNRKKLANAYSSDSKLVGILMAQEDVDLVVYSSINKVLIFNTSSINLKSARDSQGVQVLKSKNGSRMVEVKDVNDTELKNIDYYRTKNIPAVGCYLKSEDTDGGQVTLEI